MPQVMRSVGVEPTLDLGEHLRENRIAGDLLPNR
jgi:hypothetical protein